MNSDVHDLNPSWKNGGCLGCARRYSQETAGGVPDDKRTVSKKQTGYCVAFGKKCTPNGRCGDCKQVDVGELIPEVRAEIAAVAQNLREVSQHVTEIGTAVERGAEKSETISKPMEWVGKKLELEAEKSENTAGMVDAELSELKSKIGELQRDFLAQKREVAEHEKRSAKRAHSLEGAYLKLEKRMEKQARVEKTPVTARLLDSFKQSPHCVVSSPTVALTRRVHLGEIHSNLQQSIVRAGAAPRAKTQHQQVAASNRIRPFAAPLRLGREEPPLSQRVHRTSPQDGGARSSGRERPPGVHRASPQDGGACSSGRERPPVSGSEDDLGKPSNLRHVWER